MMLLCVKYLIVLYSVYVFSSREMAQTTCCEVITIYPVSTGDRVVFSQVCAVIRKII